MHLPSEHDTPIIRASIEQLTEEDLHARLDQLRERRLKAYTIYQAGIELKARAAADKALAGLDKKLDQLKKQLETVDKALDKLEKLTLDIQALRLIAGDSIV
jgi:hypothetical protein